MKVLMVCLGNICRSPIAEGIFRDKVQKLGLDFLVDSAGTAAYHVGESPDNRMISTAASMGIDISTLRARPLDVLHSTIRPERVAFPSAGKCFVDSFFKNLFKEFTLFIPTTES